MIRKCNVHGYFRGNVCPVCGSEGRYVLDDEREERLGKFVSGVLRHFPEKVGLEMDQHGWINIGQLLDILIERYRWGTKERLISLVKSDKKQRYEINGKYIRARYGHSVDIQLESDYPENELPLLYYGVSPEEIDILLEKGIFPIKQSYVHLSTSYNRSVEAASVHTDSPIILEIDAKSAQRDGIIIIVANEDIVLVRNIPADYLSVAEG